MRLTYFISILVAIFAVIFVFIVFMEMMNWGCCECGATSGGCCPCPNQDMLDLINEAYPNARINCAGSMLEYCEKYNEEHNTSIKCFE